MTHLLQRLRTPKRRHAILACVLLLACACAPLARALPGPALTVLVPLCSGGTASTHPGRQAPWRIALHFTSGAASATPGAAMAPPATPARLPVASATCRTSNGARHAPSRPLTTSRRPPPRAPPRQPLQA